MAEAPSQKPHGAVMKTIMPFYAALIAALLIVTYVPDFSLLLPKLILGYKSPVAG
jgi:TRAP-type C4-dicarboxylate transport system permease large subunit